MIDRETAASEMLERLRFQVAFAQKALAALVLVNGGAIIGMFTLIGTIAGHADTHLALSGGRLWQAFAAFVAGLAFSLFAYLGAFLSQGFYYVVAALEMDGIDPDEPDPRTIEHMRGQTAEWVAISAATLSLILFVIGSGLALASVLPA